MHATATPFVPPQYNSFGAELPGPTNKHLVVEEQFHRSASSESLRRTSQGYDYEFSFEPIDEPSVEQAIEDDVTIVSDSSHLVEAKESRTRKKSKEAENVEDEVAVAESNDDTTLIEFSKTEPGSAQALTVKDTEVIRALPEQSIKEITAILVEEMSIPAAEVSDVAEDLLMPSKEEANDMPSADLPIPAVESAREAQDQSFISVEVALASSVQALPVLASEADAESRAGSVFSEAPTEILSDTAVEKAHESAARKSAVPAASIHPFAKPKTVQRQVSKADKKKVKKQGQANKKKTEPVAPPMSEPFEPEILSLDEIKAKSKVKAGPIKLAPTAKPDIPLTEANIKALSMSVVEAGAPIIGSGASLGAVEEKFAIAEVTKDADNPATALRVPIVAKTALPVAYPRNPSQMKRVPSVTLTSDPPRKELKPSTASVASDSSFGTPKTAKEYQTPAPSPAPDTSSSPSATPLVSEAEQDTQAIAGAEAEPVADAQSKVTINAEVHAEAAEPAEIDNSASAQDAILTNKKKNQKKKRQNRDNKKKNASIDGQDAGQSQAEAPPKGVWGTVQDLGSACTGMDQDSSPTADKATLPELYDNNATPGTSSDVTGQDEKSSVSKTASIKTAGKAAKENVSGPRSWASLLAGSGSGKSSTSANAQVKGGLGLTPRDTNVGQQYNKGG